MTTISQYWQWYFPGGWAGVTLLGFILFVLTVVSYRYTMRTVRRRWKVLLIGCRILFLALLAFGLCRPALVTEKTDLTRDMPVVAVMIDESGSMRCRGYNGHSRLDEAEVFVRRLLERSRGRCEFKLFGFARQVRAVKDFAALRKTDQPENGTALFRTVIGASERLWEENCKAVIWFSDGVDTESGSKPDAMATLAASTVPQRWVPANLKLPCRPSLAITHLECPGDVRPGAVCRGLALIRKNGQLPDGKIVFTVTGKDREVVRKELVARDAGPGIFAVNFEFTVPEEGRHKLTAEVRAAGMKTPAVNWTVDAVPSVEQKILLYQGALTLDQAFLRRIFAGDKRAQLTVRFARDVLGGDNPGNRKIGTGFPGAEELGRYNVVILNALRRSQLTPRMEEDLKNFLRQGGSLLFMAVSNEAAGQFAASPLEELLPVTFDRPGNAAAEDHATNSFRRKMQEYRRTDGIARRFSQPPLRPFEITADGQRSRIFAVSGEKGETEATLTPKYQDFALVKAVKPGAVLLATAVADVSPADRARPLLAIQNYGRGRSAAICSDSLRNWKMSMPSTSNDYECFWQNLLLWLSAGNSARPAWVLPSYVLSPDQPVMLQFKLPPDLYLAAKDLIFEARQGNGSRTVLAMNAVPGRILKGEFKGAPGAVYTLTARKGTETVAETEVNFTATPSNRELDNLAPDTRTLIELALASGAALIDDERKINWDELLPVVETKKVSTVSDPLWHRSWIFLLMLGAFITELILRRACKLV